MSRPVLFVTNHAPPFRVGAFAALHEREDVVFALIGGDVRHGGGAGDADLPFPVLRPSQRACCGWPPPGASARWSPACRAASRCRPRNRRAAGRVPFVLWATIWGHPRTPAHGLSYLPLRHLYRHADAIATYGPHVSAYVRAKGARGAGGRGAAERRRRVLGGARAPSATRPSRRCSPGGWSGRRASTCCSGVGAQRHRPRGGALVTAGSGPLHPHVVAAGARVPEARSCRGRARALRRLRRRRRAEHPDARLPRAVGPGRERGVPPGPPLVATDAVGAAAGGLIEHERTGLVVPAGDPAALAAALRRLHGDPGLRARLGAAAAPPWRPIPTRPGRRHGARAGGGRCRRWEGGC